MLGENEPDRLRLERKINQYMNPRRESNQSANEQPASKNQMPPTQLTSLADRKVQSLQQYLEEVESQTHSPKHDQSLQSSFLSQVSDQRGAIASTTSNNNRGGESSMAVHKLQNDVQSLRLEVQEGQKTLEFFKGMLEKEKQRNKEIEQERKQELEKKLSEQKSELESVIERHLEFIDQLINDKKDLSKQIEVLQSEAAERDSKGDKALRELKEKFKKDLRAQQEAFQAAEKGKKEKWVSEKEREIKEMTIKGLEPEIERIIKRNKEEMKRVEEKHQHEIEELKTSIVEEYESKFRRYKEKVLSETEGLVSKEREYKNDKLKELQEKLEQRWMEERERLRTTYEEETRVLEEKRRAEQDLYLSKLAAQNEKHLSELTAVKRELDTQITQRTESERVGLQKLREQITAEKEQWKIEEQTRLREQFNSKVAENKKRAERERDQQIEGIINRLTEEAHVAEERLKQENERALRDAAAKHQEELKDLRREIKYLTDQQEKSQQTKRGSEESLEVVSRKLVDVQTLSEQRLREIEQKRTEIQSLQNQLRSHEELLKIHEQNLLHKFEKDKRKYEEQVQQLEAQIQKIKATRLQEIDTLEQSHTRQLGELEARVKAIVQKKDEALSQCREELKHRESTCAKLEELLEKQRRDLMTRFNN